MLVLMADQVSMSVGDLFMGALIPGVLLGLLYMVFLVIVGFARPDLVPPRPADAEQLTLRQVGMALLSALPTFGLILVVLGSIFFGIATPTEASGLGALGAMLLAAANGRLNLKVIRAVGIETTLTTCFIFAIFIGATVFAYVLRLIGGDELIAEFFKGLGLGPVPGDFELVEIGVMLQTSFLTPPVGFSLFYLKGVAPKGVTIQDIYVGVVPFVLLQMAMVALCFAFPAIITWLPKQMYGGG